MRLRNINRNNTQSQIIIPPPAIKILGVPVWGLRLAEYVELAKKLIKAKQKTLFTTTCAYAIAMAKNSPELFDHFQHADVVLPDGKFPVWVARFSKRNIAERVPGPDFVESFLSTAEKEGFRLFFMGSTCETLEKLKQNCLKKYPQLNIAGVLAPPFGELDDETDHRLVDAINQAHSDVLFVGMTAPKQELWLSRNFEKLIVLFAMGVGAAFDLEAQNKRRVPQWLGNLGFEWLYRIAHEPRRVWRRNVKNAVLWAIIAKDYIKSLFIK